MKMIKKFLPILSVIMLIQDSANFWKSNVLEFLFLPAQLAPVNPVLQVHVPVEASQVPWPEQSSGQVRSYE